MADEDLSPERVEELLANVHDVSARNVTAAALSKVAAKADGAPFNAQPEFDASCIEGATIGLILCPAK